MDPKLLGVGNPEVMAELIRRTQKRSDPLLDLPQVPAPDVPQRPADYQEVTAVKGAWDIARHGDRKGWLVTCWHARGPWLGADGSVLESHVPSLLLRFARREGILAEYVGLWVRRNGKWEFNSARHHDGVRVHRLEGSKELRARLTEEAPE